MKDRLGNEIGPGDKLLWWGNYGGRYLFSAQVEVTELTPKKIRCLVTECDHRAYKHDQEVLIYGHNSVVIG